MGTRVTSRQEQADVLADANATQTMESGKTPLACINKAPANFRQASWPRMLIKTVAVVANTA